MAKKSEKEAAKARSLAAQEMGRVTSNRKAKASRANGQKGGRKYKPLEEIDCTCRYLPKDDTGHIRTCLRRRALQRRIDIGLIEPINFKK